MLSIIRMGTRNVTRVIIMTTRVTTMTKRGTTITTTRKLASTVFN